MRPVLMLCYYFPPLAGGAVQRSVKFAKYLPRLGWLPTVVTAQPNPRNRIEQGFDDSLLRDVPDQVRVLRCRSVELAYLYAALHRVRLRRLLFEAERLVPMLHLDYKIGWYPGALRLAKRELERSQFGVVYSTSTPYSSHFVARSLRAERKIRWIADFRDPWTLISSYAPPSALHAAFERRLESAILTTADAVIANTETNRERLIEKFSIPGDRIHVIQNGFDPEDFAGPEDRAGAGKFMVTCVGKFHDSQDPGGLFRAVRRLATTRPGVSVRFLGTYSRTVEREARTILGPELWNRSDRVTHPEAIRQMRESSVLLANLPNETSDHWVPGKLYEYLAARRPILLVGTPRGEAAQILRRTGAGVAVPNREERILEALTREYDRWVVGEPAFAPDEREISLFDRERQARKLAGVLAGGSERTG